MQSLRQMLHTNLRQTLQTRCSGRKEFEKLQLLHKFYTYLKIIGKDEIGLIFECQNLDPVTHKCKIHSHRPGICRRYPQEELFSMGGALSDDCGYKMEPIIPFKDVIKKMSKKLNVRAGSDKF